MAVVSETRRLPELAPGGLHPRDRCAANPDQAVPKVQEGVIVGPSTYHFAMISVTEARLALVTQMWLPSKATPYGAPNP
jgi:hypothetical protein